MTINAVIQEMLAQTSLTFDTLAKDFFGADIQPGEYMKYSNVKTGVDSMTTLQTVMANAPTMRRWIGPRQEKKARGYTQTITLEPYEATMPIPRPMLAYQDKQGQVADIIKQFIGNEKIAFDLSVHSAYVANSGAGPTGYDNVALFSASHPHAPASTGGATQSNTGTLPFSAPNLDTTIAAMMSYRFENDTPMRVQPTHLRVGPKLAMQASAILGLGDRVVVVNNLGAEAATGVVAATSVGNVFKGRLELIVDPNLIGTMDDWWEVLDLSKGDAKPMQLLVGRAPEPIHQDQMWHDRRYQLDEFLYGLEGDWKPAPGIWATAFRHIL